jgi:hypothetical protein
MAMQKTGSDKMIHMVSSCKSMRLLPAKEKEQSIASSNTTMRVEEAMMHCFPIVGIGASAGGLAAFEAFFSGMPTFTAPGMAFVLVQHLVPDHKSILSGLIQRYTRMHVSEVEDGMTVQRNCAYIIPPGCDMTFQAGTLRLFEPTTPRDQRLPIDYFFKSLARDQHKRAIGIVLSGTGCDGTLGVRAIKSAGGMAMAQDPESTEFDGMPRSAIATGLVDYKLLPAEMPAQLMAYVANTFGRRSHFPFTPLSSAQKIRHNSFNPLRKTTDHVFSQQKSNDPTRRIEQGLTSLKVGEMPSPQHVNKKACPGKLTLRALTERTILKLAAPTGALVNDQGDILYLHGRTGMYLEPTPNAVSVNNILNMAREGLRDELTSALRMVVTSGKIYRRTGLQVKTNSAFTTVNLTVAPVVTGPAPTNEPPLYLILLEEVFQTPFNKTSEPSQINTSGLATDRYIASLKEQLRAAEKTQGEGDPQ